MTARKPSLFLTIVKDNWPEFKQKYPAYATDYYDSVIEKILGCGDPGFGYIDYQCMGCGQDSKRVAFSCRSMFCRNCASLFKRQTLCVDKTMPTYHTGNLQIKVAPCPSVLSTEIPPPWRCMICFTMARPSPVPPISRERALSTR